MSKVIKAVATLLRATYLDATPDSDTENNWREIAAEARAEWDAAQARIADLEQQLAAEREHRGFLNMLARDVAARVERSGHPQVCQCAHDRHEGPCKAVECCGCPDYVPMPLPAFWGACSQATLGEWATRAREAEADAVAHREALTQLLAAGREKGIRCPDAERLVADSSSRTAEIMADWLRNLAASEARAAALAEGLRDLIDWHERRYDVSAPVHDRVRALLASGPGEAAAELAGLRAFLENARTTDHNAHASGVFCECCGALATREADHGLRRRCDAHAHSGAPDLAWATVVRKAGS